MSLPNIPNITPNITLDRCDTINLLLSSIALEEIGLSHILNAEGEKLQHFLKKSPCHLNDFLAMNNNINKTLRTIVKSQMMLVFKLEEVVDLVQLTENCKPTEENQCKRTCRKDCHCSCKNGRCHQCGKYCYVTCKTECCKKCGRPCNGKCSQLYCKKCGHSCEGITTKPCCNDCHCFEHIRQQEDCFFILKESQEPSCHPSHY